MRGRWIVLMLPLLLTACATSTSPPAAPTPDEQVQVRDEAGWLVSHGFNQVNASESSPGEDPLRTRLFNPVGTTRELVLSWFAGLCLYDRSVTLSAVDDQLQITLDRGTLVSLASDADCPAAGTLYTLGLTFNRDVPAATVDLQVRGGD